MPRKILRGGHFLGEGRGGWSAYRIISQTPVHFYNRFEIEKEDKMCLQNCSRSIIEDFMRSFGSIYHILKEKIACARNDADIELARPT